MKEKEARIAATTLLLCATLLAAFATVLPTPCNAQQRQPQEGEDLSFNPVIGVDAAGNVHINTTASSTTSPTATGNTLTDAPVVYMNGVDVHAEMSVLRDMVSTQQSMAVVYASTLAARKDALRTLASQQQAITSTLNAITGSCSNASFSQPKIISVAANFPTSVFAADIDGDGDMDVLSASNTDSKIAWYENENSRGTFSAQKTITTSADGAFSVFAADLDGDGDVDVLSASPNDDKVAWYENMDGSGMFSQQTVITTAAGGAYFVYAADLNGDGDVDVLSASTNDDKVAWYENVRNGGANETAFSAQRSLSTGANGARSVVAADLDGDGDLDVLSASYNDHKLAWYENTDGAGTFSLPKIITTQAFGAISAVAADLDGDGDLDVLSASYDADRVSWYENTDGAGTFSQEKLISTSVDGPTSVVAADLDGDGDLDVISASFLDKKVAWYENTNGLGSFSEQKIITDDANGAYSVFAADLDLDGDLDVLSASGIGSKIAWYENKCL